MTLIRAQILIMITFLIFAGCSSSQVKPQPKPQPKPPAKPAPIVLSKSQQMLSAAIISYDEGEYQKAEKSIQEALQVGLTNTADKVKAHKYLAFICCASNRTKQCEDEFRKAFEVDPNFKLTPAEEGHPIWGPLYRSVRDKIAAEKKSAPK